MKILTLYTQRTLPLLRRVLAPYGTLSERGHAFSSMMVNSFSDAMGLSYSHDLTVLPNWVLTPQEVEAMWRLVQNGGRTFAYDLSDPSLLQEEIVRQTLSLCRLITVPNEYLKREVSLLHTGARVLVTPSTLDTNYFMSGRLSRLTDIPPTGAAIIGCFGPHDWHIVHGSIATFKQKHPHILFFGDEPATQILGDLVTPVRLTLDTYPALLNACTFGLCPYDGNRGQETIWAHEYGILYKPVIASTESPYPKELGSSGASRAPQYVSNKLPERWVESMETWVRRPELRARAGAESFTKANEQRAKKLAEAYLRALGQVLPQLASIV